MIFKRKRRENPWLGMAAGLIGGIAGSIAIGKFSHLWAKATHSNMEEKGMESTVKAASAISEGVFHHPLAKEDETKAASAAHYGFGGTMGALYGASAALEPRVAGGRGVPFGASVYLGAHATAVPALGLGEALPNQCWRDELGEFLGHLVYGFVTDVTRRGVGALVRAI
jgi:uncharacterized membrane protein YagU involved in acid resistance